MIQVGNKEIEPLFDTGAARSLLHEKLYRSLPFNMQLASVETSVALFDVQNKQLSYIINIVVLCGKTKVIFIAGQEEE